MISKVETCGSFCYCLDILTAIMCYSGKDFSFIQCPQNHNAVSVVRFIQCRCGSTGRFYRWYIHCQPLNSSLLDEHSCSIYKVTKKSPYTDQYATIIWFESLSTPWLHIQCIRMCTLIHKGMHLHVLFDICRSIFGVIVRKASSTALRKSSLLL